MEVSSHALELRRVGGVAFDVAVFTNISQDHLNFHPDMHHYLRAKGRLFEELGSGGKAATAVVNVDDPAAAHIIAVNRGALLTYGVEPAADVRARDVETGLRGTRFVAATPARRRRGRSCRTSATFTCTTRWRRSAVGVRAAHRSRRHPPRAGGDAAGAGPLRAGRLRPGLRRRRRLRAQARRAGAPAAQRARRAAAPHHHRLRLRRRPRPRQAAGDGPHRGGAAATW